MLDFNRSARRIAVFCTAALSIAGLTVAPHRANANPNLTPGVWTDITPPQANVGLAAGLNQFPQGVTIDPNNPNILYWCVVGYDPNTGQSRVCNIWKTTDAGSTWNPLTPMDQPLHVRIDPANSNHLYCVDGVRGNTCGFWVSNDGGATWSVPAGFTAMVNTLNSQGYSNFWDGYSIDIEPGNANHVLYSNHSSAPIVGESFDGGQTWTTHLVPAVSGSGGYSVFFLYSPSRNVGNAQTWLFCTQTDGMYRTTNSGASWTKVTGIPMNHGGNQIYYTSGGVLYAGSSSGAMKSTDNGATWQTTTSFGSGNGTMGIVGDGVTLYTWRWWISGPVYTTPESDGLNWTTSSTQFNRGPFEMVYDKVNGIVYSSVTSNGTITVSGDGIYALKVSAVVTPAAPTGLVATAGNTQVALTWNSSSGATAYDVKRSTVSGSGYAAVASPTTASYTNTGLTNGTTYYFVVDAKNSAGTSGNSNQASATPALVVPPAPTGLSAAGGNTQVVLSWNASSGATSYNALRSTVSGSGYASIATGIATTSYTNTGLTNGTAYYFVVTATNTAGTSGNGNQASATPSTSTKYEAELASLSGGAAVDTNHTGYSGTGFVDGYWTSGATTTYNVTVSSAGNTSVDLRYANGGTSTMTLSIFVNGTKIKQTSLPALANWDTWSDVIETLNLNSGSNTIAYKYDTTDTGNVNLDYIQVSGGAGGPPPVPAGLTATAGNTQVALSWNASSGATAYDVKRSTVSGSGYATVSSPTVTNYTNTGLTNGTVYYFVVDAKNASGTSANSAQVSATPSAGGAPPVPTGLTATAGNTQVALSWNASSGATAYDVKRSTVSGSGYATVTSPTTTTYTNTGLTNGTTYYFVVDAKNASGTSANSSQVSATPSAGGGETALSRTGWTATASSTEGGGSPANALDGNTGTRWSSGATQVNGQWYQINMGSQQTFNQLVLDNAGAGGDYPRGYSVSVSTDGVNWGSPIATGNPTGGPVTITFAPQTARYIKITQTATASAWWSEYEINVYH